MNSAARSSGPSAGGNDFPPAAARDRPVVVDLAHQGEALAVELGAAGRVVPARVSRGRGSAGVPSAPLPPAAAPSSPSAASSSPEWRACPRWRTSHRPPLTARSRNAAAASATSAIASSGPGIAGRRRAARSGARRPAEWAVAAAAGRAGSAAWSAGSAAAAAPAPQPLHLRQPAPAAAPAGPAPLGTPEGAGVGAVFAGGTRSSRARPPLRPDLRGPARPPTLLLAARVPRLARSALCGGGAAASARPRTGRAAVAQPVGDLQRVSALGGLRPLSSSKLSAPSA